MFNGQLKKQLEEQAAELSLLRQLRDQMGATMLSITLDTEFRMVSVNQKFAKTLGYNVEQLQGRLMADIVPAYVKNLPCFHNFRAAVSQLAPVSDDYRFCAPMAASPGCTSTGIRSWMLTASCFT